MRASSSALPTKPSIVCATFGPSPISPVERLFFFCVGSVGFRPTGCQSTHGKKCPGKARPSVATARSDTPARSAALELQDAETGIGVGEIHDALRVDIAIGRLDHL